MILRQSERPNIMIRNATDTRRQCRESGLVQWRILDKRHADRGHRQDFSRQSSACPLEAWFKSAEAWSRSGIKL